MKIDNWNVNTGKVLNWIEQNTETEPAVCGTLASIIALHDGNTDDDMRTSLWGSIRNIGAKFDTFPKARVGLTSLLDSETALNVDSVMSHVQGVFVTAFDEIVQMVILPRGQTENYADAKAFGQAMAERAKGVLIKAYKEKRWDGTLNEGVPNVALVEKAEEVSQ